MRCQALVRRTKRCQRPAEYIPDLDLALCPEHADNERALRALGLTSGEPVW